MTEFLQFLQLFFSFLIVPVLGYIIKLEKRITRLETYLELRLKEWDGADRRRHISDET